MKILPMIQHKIPSNLYKKKKHHDPGNQNFIIHGNTDETQLENYISSFNITLEKITRD